MNRFSRIVICSVIATVPAFANAQGNNGQMPRGGMMNQEQMQQMHDNMSRMQQMMQEMRSADSKEERERLRDQHMEAMQEQMDMMRGGMMGPGMMGQGMMHGQPGQDNREGDSANMSTEQRLEFMENRMNQMQLMMEQMLQHQRQMNRN